ncbi:MAG: hypothetical protein QOI62_3509 [Solirubrobacteraceae bacterium]|jgi:hypothetical protein|nr:hypothetical protein [Solirubrobacteraceae bacterium]
MLDALPHRGDGSDRPPGLALPPAPMPRRQGRRPLKRWRYVGVFGDDMILCAGAVRVAGIPQAFWAVWERGAGRLWERTVLRRGRVALPDGAARVADREVAIDLVLEPAGEAVEVTSRHGGSYIWTRKTPIRATGLVTLEGRTVALDALGLVDDSAGYHARRTAWEWSAGAGTAIEGETVAWNLVAGVHDAPGASERTVWVDGRAHEVGPVTFAPGLDAVGDLRFEPEAERVRRDDLLVVASDYRQPLGAFSGTLPDGTELACGQGVMERHRARW